MKLLNKISILLSLTALLVCLSMGNIAVNADMMPYAVEETTTSKEDAKTYADGKITLGEAKSITEQIVNAISQVSSCTPEELKYIADSMSYQTDAYSNLYKTVGDDTCGALTSYDNIKVEETDEAGKVNVTADLHFENKELKMTLHISCFDTLGSVVTSTEFGLLDEESQDFGAKMATAGSNTLMGMGTVFCVLIFISVIISCFSLIPKLMNKSEKKTENSESQTIIAENQSENTYVTEDNTELIAVIAAAIAASEQKSTDSFVVRSIRRR